ncbi:hypothetical protein P175DRAFT_0535691 [Aspergillus ochraceoroseus IBT 24754]|uniref:Uncharacterized protein n=1 Tax=Aspergillus ochraceoroseus IBT 24754 TaxID=1392256 RepID=A0A2T5LNT4_9EURO|nr:uncharacterized protein P175DRAFT_0535691 [Aspergillus ochraceoroseus IBT 24754]PTU17948.1 hypothetical protein P175DRAFT_0535691 [Aspergillus ochraceoroseus IBT 24754]
MSPPNRRKWHILPGRRGASGAFAAGAQVDAFFGVEKNPDWKCDFQNLRDQERLEIPDYLCDIMDELDVLNTFGYPKQYTLGLFLYARVRVLMILRISLLDERNALGNKWPDSLIVHRNHRVQYQAHYAWGKPPLIVKDVFDYTLSYPSDNPLIGIVMIVAITAHGNEKEDYQAETCCKALMTAVHRAKKEANMPSKTVYAIITNSEWFNFFQYSRISASCCSLRSDRSEVYSHTRRIIRLATEEATRDGTRAHDISAYHGAVALNEDCGLHQRRKADGKVNCIVYGIASDGFEFIFIRISNAGTVTSFSTQWEKEADEVYSWICAVLQTTVNLSPTTSRLSMAERLSSNDSRCDFVLRAGSEGGNMDVDE